MAEQRSILNDPPKVLDGPRLLHRLIDFDIHQDSCALDFSTNNKRKCYSYGEIHACVEILNSQIQQILQAKKLANLSFAQHVVPILLPQSPGLYISQLAILESGGAFCSINLDAPKERIKFVAQDVSATIIITTSEFKDSVSWEGGPEVIITDEFPDVSGHKLPKQIEPREALPDDLAYVMYTSGSSGTPKGVGVSHLAASQSLLAHEKHIPLFKRFLQFAAPSFDVSVFEIFFPLKRGATLVGCSRSKLLNDLPGMINELDVDAAELTPTVVGSLLQRRSSVPGLNLLLTIGEMLTRPIVEEFGGSDSKAGILYGMYGPTEAAIHCTVYPNMASSTKPGNIGLPLDTVSAFIAAATSSIENDENLTFLPVGELGELVLGGPQLAQGYLNRPDQNKAAFLQIEGRRYYRTGDKARILIDGSIEILGRISAGQVKLRGQRVELGEIEEAVYRHEGIKTVAAVVLSGALIVFALVGDQELDSDQVLETCSKWLPKFMIPSEIILLHKFPYLPSGKVDRRTLESDYRKQREDRINTELELDTLTERTVGEVLRGLLGPFPADMRLAAAGLDSLMAIRVSSKLRSLGYGLTTLDVLQVDTLKALANVCEVPQPTQEAVHQNTQMEKESTKATLNGSAGNVESTIACTPLQSAMLAETAMDKRAYRNWIEIEIPGANNTDEIVSSLYKLADLNPVLRSGFTETYESKGYIQVVWKTLASSQIKVVQEFNYDFSETEDASLKRPLRVQVLSMSSFSKILIHIHHALYDAWSLELLLDDLDDLLAGKVPIQRPSFTKVVDGYLNGSLISDSWAAKDYWKDHLFDLDLRPLPNFHSEQALPAHLTVASLQTSISTSDLEAAARRLSSSPQSIFQAAYAQILSSYLGSPDVCFGTVFSGRTLPISGIEDIVGPCLSTLPVRVDISTSDSLQDLVQLLNSTNRKHLKYSAVPLRDIKTAAGADPRQPLFDTLLIWQQTLHNHDHKREHVTLLDSVDNLEFNLTLEIVPGVGAIELKANYQELILPKVQVDLLLQQLEQVVQMTVFNPKMSILNVFSEIGDDLLSIENESPIVALGSETLSSPVERIAAEDPDRPAIEFVKPFTDSSIKTESISYSRLNSRANRLGNHLLDQKVLPDDLVCICMEKCIDLYASILATAKVGAGYLPVTPDIPQDRLRHILDEAKVKVVVSRSECRPLFTPFTRLKVIYLDELEFAALSPQNFASRFSSELLSYCVFTSGSTGTPKGVLVTQGNLVSNLDVLERLYPAERNVRFLQSCSQAFDVSVFEIFFTWRIGGCICSATKDVLFRDIEYTIRELHVTHLSLTPTVAALIDPNTVPEVQFLVTAGEAVTQKVFNTWADRGLYQGYGPSETTNICTVKPNVTQHDLINNIGRPFQNTSAFVLSPGPDFSLVPKGGEGEFCFGGSQVFRGYLDKKQEKGKIIQHPKFGRLYRSGDFGRLLSDGSLVFTGRKDDQVKIRGQRVELGEITNVLLRSKHVEDCVTMVADATRRGGPPRLICFWTAPGAPNPPADLKYITPDTEIISKLYHSLESTIPSYMIPSALMQLSFLPSTPQGKIDKRTLLNLYTGLSTQYLESVAHKSPNVQNHTWTDLELQIANSLAGVSSSLLEDIKPDTYFFSLGIDSISAISFSRDLRKTTGYQVEISDILKNPSVLRLAALVSSKSRELSPAVEGSRHNSGFGFDKDFLKSSINSFNQSGSQIQSILPCTPLQEAMLSAADASVEKVYNNHVIFEVNGNIERLQQCWQEMVVRHEILRTFFTRTDLPQHPYVQVVLQEFVLRFGIIEGVDSLEDIIQGTEKHLPSDENKPPYSLDILNLPGSIKLLLSMNHALYDGVALEILYQEIETLYNGGSLPPPVSFSPFLTAIASTDLEESEAFWRTTMQNCSPTRLQITSHHNAQIASPSRIERLSATQPLRWIEGKIMRYNTSLLAVCHSVWAGLISELTQQSDVCFGSVVSGRTIQVDGIERLVAPCFNTIPSRLQNTDKISYLEAFRNLQSLSTNSLPFQSTPLRRIQSKFSPDGSRLFDTLFILQQPSRTLDANLWSILEDDGVMDFPLVCEVVTNPAHDTLEIILHSHTSILSIEDTHALMVSFETNLKTALENPRRQLLSTAIREGIAATAFERENTPSTHGESTLHMEPLTEREKELRDVLALFTDTPVEKITRDISVFRLGLDSISTVQVATRLRKLGHQVMTSDILEHSSIAKLDNFLHSERSSETGMAAYDFPSFDNKYRAAICSKMYIQADNIDAIRPCTAVQQGMIAQSLHFNGAQYINSVYMELSPHVSISNIKAAWNMVAKEHEILRTGLAQIEDVQYSFGMITYSKESFSVPWFDASDHQLSETVILDNLPQCAWAIGVSTYEDRTIVQLIAHHAIYDAQSLQMILSDVARSYDSRPLSHSSSIKPLLGAILVAGEDTESHKQFWMSDENKIVVNRFPDLTSLQLLGIGGIVAEISSATFTSDLEEACKNAGVTMQAAGQAAWARLLASYTGEISTTFGTTLSGRSVHEDADKIAFPSIVTIPVRCDVQGTNQELLMRTMNGNAALQKHQFTPLTSIQKWTGYPEGKIFDTLFAYQKVPEGFRDIEYPWKIIKEETSADYAVSLEMQPEISGKMSLRLTFRGNSIPVEHADMILRQFDALLLDTLLHPQSPCDIAPDIESELLSITPAKEKLLPGSEKLLHEFVESGALRSPDKTALEFTTSFDSGEAGKRTWSYMQLSKEGNRVARLLLRRGVKQGEMVGICFDKCPEASFAIIGILKAGCTYVALDPTAPIDRLNFIVEDCGAGVVLTAGSLVKKLGEIVGADVVSLSDPESLKNLSFEPPILVRDIRPEDTAYCLYTSGTTGTPKGCLITHQSVVQFMFFFQRLFTGRWNVESKWLQFASFHFDVSLVEQFWSWSVGICVASAPRDLIFEDIPGAIRQLGITHIDLTPSLARLIHPDDVPSLWDGIFITGGEQLKQDILDVWGEKGCIHNSYGPTEATIGVTTFPKVPKNGKPSNIGPQFDNVGSFVLKPGSDTPVLRGGVGELCVSGVLVGEGYLNRPDLTATRFPTLKDFNERIYRTGDLVRILHDGCFLFQGRADDQVKLRGQRLELSEINEVIKRSSSELDEIITLVLKHSMQQKEQLVAFFVVPRGSGTNPESLTSSIRDACKASLPGYMVPTHFIPIQALPLNVNNKADSKQLATIYNNLSIEDLQQLSHSSAQAKPWTTEEQKIVHKISHALHVNSSSISRETNLFELGLDSISIIRFSRRLQEDGLPYATLSVVRNNLNIDALIRALMSNEFQHHRLDDAYVSASQNIAAFSQKHMVNICKNIGTKSSNVEIIAPCTPVQEGMIYRFLESDSPLYFNKFEYTLDTGVSMERLLLAWERVIARLQILRTKFVATDDGYAQVVLKARSATQENQSIDYDNCEKQLALKTPHTLTLSTTATGNLMTLSLFHGLYDGISLDLLLEKFAGEYSGQSGIDYGPPFHSSLPYGPLAKVPGAQEFWTNHLRSWSYKPTVAPSNPTGSLIATKKITGLGNRFEKLRRSLAVAPQAIIQALWLSVIQARVSSDLTIGMVVSGRAIELKGAEEIIGPLFNTIPFHAEIQDSMTTASFISLCHNFNMQMQDYQHTPLRDIQKWSTAKPHEPLFDTLFVFQRQDSSHKRYSIWRELEATATADYPLAFEATLTSDGEFDLIIVTQRSFITLSEASEILEEVGILLETTLAEDGLNVISDRKSLSPTSLNLSNGNSTRNDQNLSQVNKNGSFRWGKEANTIRAEISSLADVAEMSVQDTSSIFELGLDSIDVIKLSSRLQKHGIEIPVSTIIKCQTISQLVLNIGKKVDATATSEEPRNGFEKMSNDLSVILQQTEPNGKFPKGAVTALPATPLQQSMVNEMIRSDYTRYFNIEAFHLRQDTDVKSLKSAVESVIAASPILRTSFLGIDDPRSPVTFAQIIRESHPEVKVVSGNQSMKEFVDEFKTTSARIAASSGVLFQVAFITSENSDYMVMAISHALYDGTSLQLIHQDIFRAYNGNLPERPNFVPFLAHVFESTTEEAKTFWKTTLSGLPPANLPIKSASQTSDRTHSKLEITSRVNLGGLERLCKSLRITLQTLGQTCWAIVLSYLMSQLDVVFGTVLSCRDSEEANEVMFPLMNTVAIRSVMHGSLSEMLKYTQEMSDAIRQYQHFPLGTAQAFALASSKDRSVTGTKLFDTLFIYQGRRAATSSVATLYEPVYGSSEVEFPVCVEMEIVDGCVVWTTACKSAARNKIETKEIVEMLDSVLEHFIDGPDSPTVVSDAEGISVGGLPKFQITVNSPTQSVDFRQIDSDDEWSSTELAIRTALYKVSGVSENEIGKDVTIFHLGLDSILALKLPVLLNTYGVKLKVSDILKNQTIRAMAISAASNGLDGLEVLDTEKILAEALSSFDLKNIDQKAAQALGGISYIMPATAGQVYMIRMWQVSQGILFYPHFSHTLSGKLDKKRLECAWESLLERHDILRTGFVDTESQLLQIVFKKPSRLIGHKAGISTELVLPPVELVVELATADATILKLHIHHALYDGISLPLLFSELEALYRKNSMEATGLSYKKFVAQSLLASKTPITRPTTREKWTAYLGKESLYQYHPTPHGISVFQKRTEAFQKGRKTSPMKELAKKTGVSIDSLLLAATAQLLASNLKHESISQVIFGIYLANRAPFGEDISSLAAPTLNLLPLQVRKPLNRSIAELAAEIQHDLFEISSARMSCASLAEIYEWTGVRVNFFVNIHKGAVDEIGEEDGILGVSENPSWKKNVEETPNGDIVVPADGRCDAYLPAVDIEIRCHGEKIDVGVFAPSALISLDEAESFIEHFVEYWA